MNVLNKKDKETTKFDITLKQKGILQVIKNPTRITATAATCIDLCYTNSNIVAKAKVRDVSLSDHELILVSRKKGPVVKEKCDFYGRSYKHFDREAFNRMLLDHDWEPLNFE